MSTRSMLMTAGIALATQFLVRRIGPLNDLVNG